METAVLLVFAFVLDTLIGDPDWQWHPVRLIGKAIKQGESWLRPQAATQMREFALGLGLTVGVVCGVYVLSAGLLDFIGAVSCWLEYALSIFLGSLCLARRSLKEHAEAVLAPLRTGDVRQARLLLARMVSRDTTELSEAEIVRGTVESVAESSSDGVIAPLFYLALGGVPLVLAYKAASTLDSMIGYRTERYEYFGKAAARLDDCANFVPARLTVLALVGAAWIGKCFDYPFAAAAAWRVAWRDGHKHESPNAGYPEATVAGALGVQLGGANRYHGEVVDKPQLGDNLYPLSPSAIAFSTLLLDMASLLALAALALGSVLWSV